MFVIDHNVILFTVYGQHRGKKRKGHVPLECPKMTKLYIIDVFIILID